ncbi:hypothetical protein LNQ52_20185 [Klebsiella pneumoniae subsp. pneumoniae]|nr:hypothetical protein [Klebsiella pneumoniae subsp. pneumoniae]
MEGGATVAGKSTANAQETLEASKDTAINKRPFNGISSRFTDPPSFFTELRVSYQGLIARKYDTAEEVACRDPSDDRANRLPYRSHATTDNEQTMQDSVNQPGFLFHDY